MANNPLWAVGTGGFGLAPINLMTTELNSLATATTAVTSGSFDQGTNTNSFVYGVLSFVAGGSFTPTGTPSIPVWFLQKADNTNFELSFSNAYQPRQPDAWIPFAASAYASGNVARAEGLVQIPALPFKVLVLNVTGVTLPTSGNKLTLGGVSFA